MSDDLEGPLVREILEAACQRDGLSLESGADPGEPARNYELALRLGIGHVFGLEPDVLSPPGARALREAASGDLSMLEPWERTLLLPYARDEEAER